jgi:hypothetical protein
MSIPREVVVCSAEARRFWKRVLIQDLRIGIVLLTLSCTEHVQVPRSFWAVEELDDLDKLFSERSMGSFQDPSGGVELIVISGEKSILSS